MSCWVTGLSFTCVRVLCGDPAPLTRATLCHQLAVLLSPTFTKCIPPQATDTSLITAVWTSLGFTIWAACSVASGGR
eukprot:m.489566 g.489566  ORF g.489566 m.489566 type:complete len:77 (+) comp21769_c0_seq8:74-304(+)